MPNKTNNYQLNQWEPADGFLRADFNEDNAKIDAALTDLSEQIAGIGYVAGKYTGTGTYPRTISIGFQPTAVIITGYTGLTNLSGAVFGGVFSLGNPLFNYAEVSSDGFTLTREQTNQKDNVYNYIAFK